jgi:chaperone modulatory protein CbpM
MNSEQETRVGIVLDESVEFSLSEICRSCHVHAEVIIQLVEIGALEPRGNEPDQWRFPGHALRRIERALNLQRDLEINLAGVALVLDLLDEIEQLRGRLRTFERET